MPNGTCLLPVRNKPWCMDSKNSQWVYAPPTKLGVRRKILKGWGAIPFSVKLFNLQKSDFLKNTGDFIYLFLVYCTTLSTVHIT
jgi:hypothetical protein